MTAYQYQYDLAGRLTQVDNAGSVVPEVTLSMAYDYEGNRTWLSDSQGGSVWYAWNNQRLQSMALYTADYKSAQVGFGYDSVGRLSSLTRTANGDFATPVTTSFTLDLLDRVTGITHSKGIGEDASTLSQFGYAFDANSRVTNYTGPEGSLSYALDTNGQLLSVTGSRSEDYALDANGNRTSNTTTAGNLLLNDGKYSYTYDLEGNQKTKTRISDGQLTEYFWDHRNQLTKALVKDANGVLLKELRFTYDVEGRRVGSWVDADGDGPEEPDQVWTVFDGVNPYMDFDGDGLLKTRYLYGPGIDELFARIGAGEDPEWYLADRLGSVRQIVDASGAVLDEITYDSFGGILIETNPAQGDRFKFTGREYSPELGIYYYRARWYDPGSGRFISRDPIGFSAGDVNLYRYVGNAPGDATDPSGLVPPLTYPNFKGGTNEISASISFSEDFATSTASWYAWSTSSIHMTVNPNDPEKWKIIHEKFKKDLDGRKIKTLLITGHGTIGAFGAYKYSDTLNLDNLTNEGDALSFFTWLKEQRSPFSDKTSYIEIKACSVAREDDGKKFIIKLSKITGYPVRAWDDWIIAIPFGKEFTAYPDGTSRETGDTHLRFQDTWFFNFKGQQKKVLK